MPPETLCATLPAVRDADCCFQDRTSLGGSARSPWAKKSLCTNSKQHVASKICCRLTPLRLRTRQSSRGRRRQYGVVFRERDGRAAARRNGRERPFRATQRTCG